MSNDIRSLRNPLWFLSFLIALLCLLTTINFFLLLGSGGGDATVAGSQQAEREEPIFVKVGPMTVNLRPNSYGERLLYTGLSLRVADEQTRDQLRTHLPEIHSRLLVLLSDQEPANFDSAAGKEELKAAILALFDKPLAKGWPRPKVVGVFFTDFIIQ